MSEDDLDDGLPERLLAVWDRLDEGRMRYSLAALGITGHSGERWQDLRERVLATGRAVEAGDSPDAVVPRPGTRRTDSATDELRRRLLAHWRADPDPELVVDVLHWATALGEWAALDVDWLELVAVSGRYRDPQMRRLLASLPTRARQVSPALSWAWAAATNAEAPTPLREIRVAQSFVADGIRLHAAWRRTPGVDAAVLAGANWIMAQTMMPAPSRSRALDAASQTQAEVADFIAQHRREGEPPSAHVEVVFRAASARLALARADLHRTIAEADFAIVLDPVRAERLTSGARAVASELLGFAAEVDELPEAPDWTRSGTQLRNEVSLGVARALGTLRLVDQAATARALALLEGMPQGAPLWTVTSHARQLAGALWGETDHDLGGADSFATLSSIASLEKDDPLAAILFRRGQTALLCRLGDPSGALEAARALPAPWRAAAEACALLWAGRLSEAVRTADTGLRDASTTLMDRAVLLVVRAASLSQSSVAAAEASRTAAVTAVRFCSDHQLWLPLALVPTTARARLLAQLDIAPDAPGLPEPIRDRLAGLPTLDAGQQNPITLSAREQILLPLLASADSVPQIAARLHVSPNTVRKQVVTLRAKLGASSRAELVRRGREAGLL